MGSETPRMLDGLENAVHKYRPPEVLSCANINANRHTVCENPGKQPCKACKLVSYCSKGCQNGHWATHKKDCNHAIRSSNWKPGWIVKGRDPSFISNGGKSTVDDFQSTFQERLSLSLNASLWGNVQAMDVINLPDNEVCLETDLSLAFAASGDIRHLITTVNALGPNYTGKLSIVLNDRDPFVVSRNIILLLILGTITDETIAADMALHFWYSIFMPMEYHLRILSVVSKAAEKGKPDTGEIFTSLGPQSTLSCLVSPDVLKLLRGDRTPMSADEVRHEYTRVRTAPSRADFRDRMYLGLKPSHRLAFLQYRKHGIILPFGAPNIRFDAPNLSLFADGVWLQTDFADPLESWDLDQIFQAGKAHGAQPEDVYGCLYFFLTDQLRAFARNLRQHRISFHVFDLDACELARGIAQGKLKNHGIPTTTLFDRIEVSNIMDPNYVGIPSVVNEWGPLLAKTNHATLLGYFMNWAAFTRRGRAMDTDPFMIMGLLGLMEKSNRVCSDMDSTLGLFLDMRSIDAFYDNSKAFAKFWYDQGGTNVQLQLRDSHKIVPHRVKTEVDARPDALPNLTDDETWYRYSSLVSLTWIERFVELCQPEDRPSTCTIT